MANGGQRRTRSERVAALELPPGRWERAWLGLCQRDVLARIALAFLAAVAVCVIIKAWDPPLRWRTGMVPTHYVTAHVEFKREDQETTRQARLKAREETKAVFIQDVKPLQQLRADLRNTVAELTKTEALTDTTAELWKEFLSPAEKKDFAVPVEKDKAEKEKGEKEKGGKEPRPQPQLLAFQEFRKGLAGKDNLDQLDQAAAAAFAPLEQHGLLADLKEQLNGFNKKTISVYSVDSPYSVEHPSKRHDLEVSEVTVDPQAIRQRLTEMLPSKAIADRVWTWLEPRLLHHTKPLTTFTKDDNASKAAQDESEANVAPITIAYSAGNTLVKAGESINQEKLDLLGLEREAFLAKRPWADRVSRGAAIFLVVFAMFTICGMYMRYRQRGVQAELDRLAGALALAVVTVAVAVWAAGDPWRAEPVGLILFGMTVAIAYRSELALLFTGVVSWIVVLAMGADLAMFLLLFGTTAAAVLNVGRIRSRSKLIYVGLFAGCVAAVLDLAMKMIDNQPLDTLRLAREAGHQFLWATMAGFLMTGLLPFVERLFGVLTDLSLLELGDITHPVLQELVRRAEHLQPLDHRRLDCRGRRRLHRRPRPALSRRRLLPRHRQDAQAGLLRREPGARRQPPRGARARHEHAGDHRPHQGRRRPRPAAPPAASDHRHDPAAPRHDAHGVLLRPRRHAAGRRSQRQRD